MPENDKKGIEKKIKKKMHKVFLQTGKHQITENSYVIFKNPFCWMGFMYTNTG